MPTVYDVARLAGVSTATVSRVMRASDLVRPDTGERVLAVIDEVGFVPDASAQGLSRRRKEIIGLVALERAVDETGIERDGLLFVDQPAPGGRACRCSASPSRSTTRPGPSARTGGSTPPTTAGTRSTW